jgi:hypothetical protein
MNPHRAPRAAICSEPDLVFGRRPSGQLVPQAISPACYPWCLLQLRPSRRTIFTGSVTVSQAPSELPFSPSVLTLASAKGAFFFAIICLLLSCSKSRQRQLLLGSPAWCCDFTAAEFSCWSSLRVLPADWSLHWLPRSGVHECSRQRSISVLAVLSNSQLCVDSS